MKAELPLEKILAIQNLMERFAQPKVWRVYRDQITGILKEGWVYEMAKKKAKPKKKKVDKWAELEKRLARIEAQVFPFMQT